MKARRSSDSIEAKAQPALECFGSVFPCTIPPMTGKHSQGMLVRGNSWLSRPNTDGALPIQSEYGPARARALLRNSLPAPWKRTFRLLESRCPPATGRKFPPTTSPISTIISTAHRKKILTELLDGLAQRRPNLRKADAQAARRILGNGRVTVLRSVK